MRKNRVRRVGKFLLFGALALAVFSFVAMHLWNHLLTALFGWPVIGFWQAAGLLILSRIFFGFRGRGGGHMYWRRRMMERWERMTPEEREKFRAGLRAGCGPLGGSQEAGASGGSRP